VSSEKQEIFVKPFILQSMVCNRLALDSFLIIFITWL